MIWLETYKKGKVAYKSYQNYKLYVERHIIPELGHLKMKNVRPVHIQQLYASKSYLSASALKHISIAVNGIFKAGLKNLLCLENPAAEESTVKKPKRRPTIYSPEDAARIVAYAHTHPLGHFVLVPLYTGMREGELCALLWDDVHLERRVY